MAVTTTIGVAILLVVCIYLYAPAITAVFNGEGNQVLASYAENGLRLYFIGFLFAGMNIVGTAIFKLDRICKICIFCVHLTPDLLRSSFLHSCCLNCLD